MTRREASKDPRAVRTRQALISATLDLLEQHSAHDLSVTTIVREAGVSRQVFYEHFTDRDGVVFAGSAHRQTAPTLQPNRRYRLAQTFALYRQLASSTSMDSAETPCAIP